LDIAAGFDVAASAKPLRVMSAAIAMKTDPNRCAVLLIFMSPPFLGAAFVRPVQTRPRAAKKRLSRT
jgi:hypothetical protein